MLNEKIRHYRKAKGWTQDDLAERSGYSRSSIINWESGKRAPRTVDIERLAVVFGVSPKDLLDDELFTLDKETTTNTEPLSNQPIKATGLAGFQYWGGVLDEANKVAESRDHKRISMIAPLLRAAYEVLASAMEHVNADDKGQTENSAYNGDNSSYIGNTFITKSGVPA